MNCANLLIDNVTDKEKLHQILPMIEAGVYVNSDMHMLSDFSFRQAGFDYLKDILKPQKTNEI
ncbi:MAG: hypothetical protein WCP92_07755 [bacterium]